MKIKVTKIIDDGFDLKKEMSKKGYSLRSFSKKIGIHFTLIDRYRNGLHVSEETAEKIKKALSSNKPSNEEKSK